MEIYAIKIDKGNGEFGWYIGQTLYSAERRFKSHLRDSKSMIHKK